jgi:NADPH-dependent ferric siderophore reductase
MTKEITRIRHEGARRRTLTVAERRQLSPNFLAIRFACDDLSDFVSLSEDDHIKLFFEGAVEASGKPPMRDYTPRRWDKVAGTFEVEFALHDDPGPATAWAVGAQPGDTVEIGGPRGSMVVGDGFDWYWMIGDEAALPAIGRYLDERPDGKIDAFIAVANAAEQIPLNPSAQHSISWVHRAAHAATDPAPLLAALATRPFPAGDGFIWIAAEAGVAKSVRAHVEAAGHPSEQLKAKGYWTAGGTLDG